MSSTVERVVIIGAGPAGYTAAIYAARASLKPLLLSGFEPGGQLMITSDVENYPGFPTAVQGPWLMDQFRAQAENVGARLESEHVVDIDASTRPFRITCDSGRLIEAHSIILATGAKAKWLGLPAEEAFRGFGVSACATCDGYFFRGKNVVVVGGGNTAVEEALYLSGIVSSVTLVHRRNAFRAERILIDRLMARSNVSVLWNNVIEDICGGGSPKAVDHLVLRDVTTQAVKEYPTDGLFVAIGHEPQTELIRGKVELKPSGYVRTAENSTATSVDGIFAAGDVADDIFRQAVTAAGFGCMAALEVDRWLVSKGY